MPLSTIVAPAADKVCILTMGRLSAVKEARLSYASVAVATKQRAVKVSRCCVKGLKKMPTPLHTIGVKAGMPFGSASQARLACQRLDIYAREWFGVCNATPYVRQACL
ncbi:hypothetical protein ABBQ32_006302 [Trebouxia sp. C0010 RCD-2024]